MQETVLAALAHSLSCGMALIDDEALDGVRAKVERSLKDLAAKGEAKEGAENGEEDEEERRPRPANWHLLWSRVWYPFQIYLLVTRKV